MRFFFHKIIFILNLVAIVSLLSSIISPFINPNLFWPISFFGLFFPIIITLCVFFSIFWFFHNKKYLWINIIFLMISSPFLLRYIAVNKTNTFNKEGIKVMSYNVRLFNKWEWIKDNKIKEKSIDFINNQDLDIICIQEYYDPHRDLELDFKYSHIGLQKKQEDWHMAIYSNYPQINKKTVEIDGLKMNNSCIYSDIVINLDTVRVYNIHLASNFFQKKDFDYLISVETEKVKNGVIGIGKKLKYSFERRGREVNQIKSHMNSCPYPIILCGDFNDTPVSYAYQKLGENMTDAFLDSGNGFGASFSKIPTLRIDYIFLNKGFKSYDFTTHEEEFSDHRAVSCLLKLN